jgi:hypothetical protein
MNEPGRCPVFVEGPRWGGVKSQCIYKEGHIERGRQRCHAYGGTAISGLPFIDDEKLTDAELRN